MSTVSVRAHLVTHCLGCSKRIHAPSEESFARQKLRHLRNCPAKKLHGQLVPLEQLPVPVAAKLAAVLPRPTFWQRLKVLGLAILHALRLR